MVRFNLFFSNRMEALAEQLADSLRTPLSDPMRGELVVVQNRGTERWISMQLALRQGICANLRFPFPRAFLCEMVARLTGVAPGDDYEPEILAWRISHILPGVLDHPDYRSLKRYLADDPAHLKKYQLASAIARAFDRYWIFRPEMIAAWEKGENGTGKEAWQADLWRRVRGSCRAEHWIGHRRQMARRLAEGPAADGLPERISIFGISALPPFYLDFFHLLSQYTEVNGFFLNPCEEFWADIRSEKEMGRMVQKVREETRWKSATAEDLYLEKGNSLLASLGRQGRSFFGRLANLPAQVHEDFRPPGEGSLLEMIQSDILRLRERGGNGIPKSHGSADDRSVRIHSCHGPLREIEVLHDQLLEMFAREPDLLPKDILVMSPDIEKYAPLIEAVFAPGGRGADPEGRGGEIPYGIADYGNGSGRVIRQSLSALLDLVTSRFGVSGVLSLLDAPPVRRRFALEEGEVERIRRWIAEAGIRWGIDAEDRAGAGLPALRENTWRHGLDRLLLGYAMPAGRTRVFRGVVPCDDIEGKTGEILGRFLDFAEALFSFRSALKEPRSLPGWAALVSALVAAFFLPGDEQEEEELRSVRRRLEEIAEIEGKSGYRDPVEFAVVKSLLQESFDAAGHPYGYMTGGVTFCAMLPMRSIPFRVVCLLGMNNADYPRRSEPVDFDLLSENPRPGDPSRRDEDRYLFLEALLSARRTLYISYVGQSGEDNSPIPPSVLVSELIDYLEAGVGFEGETVRDRIVTDHRLQAFHPAYFSAGERLFSYSAENCRAAQRLADPSRTARNFSAGRLPEPEEGWREITTADLAAFFRNPSRYLLERGIGLSLEEGPEMPAETELFRIGGLERYRLGDALLDHTLGGGDPRTLLPVMMASGGLPHGTTGTCEYDNLCRDLEVFAGSAGELIRGRQIDFRDVDLDSAGFHLSGRIGGLCGPDMVRFRYAAVRGRDHLRLWTDLLLLCNAGPEDPPAAAFLLGREEGWRYTAPEDARQSLGVLLELYSGGMRRPAPFFPESSLAYAEAVGAGKIEEEALRRAKAAWTGNEKVPGEGEDPYFRLCFGADLPEGREFRDAAVAVFGPLLRHREKRGR